MRILYLNGSPKMGVNASGKLIDGLKARLKHDGVDAKAFRLKREAFIELLKGVDTLVMSFPLYVDGLPSHLLRLLDETKDEIKSMNLDITVHVMANNGFMEGSQNKIAIDMVKYFTTYTGLKFGQGIGVGAAPMLEVLEIGKEPKQYISKALDHMAMNILSYGKSSVLFYQPAYPKIMYKLFGRFHWRSVAKKNGVKYKQLYNKRLETDTFRKN